MMQSLCGVWKLAADRQNQGRDRRWFDSIQPGAHGAVVPGVIQQVLPDAHGVFWYWRHFSPSRKMTADERCLLTFDAVDYLADVYVNGQHVGSHEGGETPFTVDVTEALRPRKDNLLAVRVLNPYEEMIDGFVLGQTPHRNKDSKDYTPGKMPNVGGIVGKVELTIVPGVHIADVFVRPDPYTGAIRIAVTVANDTATSSHVALSLSVSQALSGEKIDTSVVKVSCPPGRSGHEMMLHVRQPKLWDLNAPHLYRVTTTLTADDGRDGHESVVRCGFRELKVERGYFRLNGKRIILKSTHTGNHFPIGQSVPVDPDLVRRDMLMAKVAGYNCVRFIAGMAMAEQLDFADEIGMMVYEESMAGWCLENSPNMKTRFDASIREMILRDRNHPSVAIWGLLNEMGPGAVFDAAVEAISWLRDLDDTRIVLLSSGRWDARQSIGSVCNPHSRRWECVWGTENVDEKTLAQVAGPENGGYIIGAGDAHMYPPFPHTAEMAQFLTTVGTGTKPIFLTEYGIGSLLDVVRGCRWFEQQRARNDLIDVRLFREMAERLETDWKRWGFHATYPFVGDMLRDSQRLHSRQRRQAFDRIRANPNICGYNLTGMLDHGITGEGVWTFWREWKPESPEVLEDGWASLRWCLFVDSLHGYSGRTFALRAVLANEDVLGPGDYPCIFAIHGPTGTLWEKRVTLKIPHAKANRDLPLTFEVLCETVKLTGRAGEYTFSAYMEQGGAPFGGRRTFRIAQPIRRQTSTEISTFGVPARLEKWLAKHGVRCQAPGRASSKSPTVVLVGDDADIRYDNGGWKQLAECIARGGYAIFTTPSVLVKTSGRPIGAIAAVGTFGTSDRTFEVVNAPEEEWPIYSKEFYGSLHFVISKLPTSEVSVKLDFCEGGVTSEGGRIFDVTINGRTVLKDFDIVKQAGGPHRAISYTFQATPKRGIVDLRCAGPVNVPSLSRISVFNKRGELIAQESAARHCHTAPDWLPLAEKGTFVDFNDWLYHKECVAKSHPIFDGLQSKGIMDWDEYGPVISRTIYEGSATPANVIAAAFATGYPCKGGYASGLMLAEYAFGKGRFLINTLNVMKNIDSHPAADRLLLNMIQHAQSNVARTLAPLPKNFASMLKAIGYASESR